MGKIIIPSAAHVRTGSTGSLSNSQVPNQTCPPNGIMASSSQEELRCFLEHQHQGHQQPITCMEVVGNTVLTGSQDHTLKVLTDFRLVHLHLRILTIRFAGFQIRFSQFSVYIAWPLRTHNKYIHRSLSKRNRRFRFTRRSTMCLGSHYGRLHVQHSSARRCNCVASVCVELCDFIGCRRTLIHLGTIPRESSEHNKCAICLHKHIDANAVTVGGLQTR